MDRKKQAGRRGAARGTSTVELAVVLPLLLLLIFGAIEAGNALSIWLTVQNAADVGARYASTGQGVIAGTQLNDIINAVNTVLVNSRGHSGAVTVSSWAGTNASGSGRANNPGGPCDTVEVKVVYQYQTVTPIAALMAMFGKGGWNAQIPMTAYARRINEPWQPCP